MWWYIFIVVSVFISSYCSYWRNSKDVEASRDTSLSLYQFVCPHIVGTDERVKTYKHHVIYLYRCISLYVLTVRTIWGHKNWYNDKDISRDASTSLLFLQYKQYEDIKTDTMIKIYHVMLLRLYCFFNTNNMRTYKLIQR
jgi:hypothetical protein